LPKFDGFFTNADRRGYIKGCIVHKMVLMAGRRMAVAAMGTAALFLCSHAMGQTIVWSHERKLSVSPSAKGDEPKAEKVVWSPDRG
jgi:hypothetical protein